MIAEGRGRSKPSHFAEHAQEMHVSRLPPSMQQMRVQQSWSARELLLCCRKLSRMCTWRCSTSSSADRPLGPKRSGTTICFLLQGACSTINQMWLREMPALTVPRRQCCSCFFSITWVWTVQRTDTTGTLSVLSNEVTCWRFDRE